MSVDFSFLGERITAKNSETDFFLVDSNPVYINVAKDKELESDHLLLQFKQRVWNLTDIQSTGAELFFSYSFQEGVDLSEFHIHDILYQNFLSATVELSKQEQLIPTLSFRTLIYNNTNHIKFGLPIHYGKFLRDNSRDEILKSLFLSDYIQHLPLISKLNFFREYKGYVFPNLEQFGVSYRTYINTSRLMPIGCYFNKILNCTTKTPEARLKETLLFTANLCTDLNSIWEELDQFGLGLEIHGQNLLVETNERGHATRQYVYRDLGNCTLSPVHFKQQSALIDYYYSNYQFEFESKWIKPPTYRNWLSYRIFIVGFLLYNTDQFVKKEKIEFNVYDWFDGQLSTAGLHYLKNLY